MTFKDETERIKTELANVGTKYTFGKTVAEIVQEIIEKCLKEAELNLK
ncbi:MAG: hypothetical protein LIR50_06950 [Bacillota bacterium]|nr:hypothetical protein [Bacillota bacterium]